MRITKEVHAPAQSTIFPPETTAPSTEQGAETITSLATIETTSAALIYAPGALTGLVDKIKAEVRGQLEGLDVSIPKHRERIISLAARVASAKVKLDKAGDSLNEKYRAIVTAVNADRKVMRDDLDAFKIEVRKPVTDLENAEKERIATHEAALAEISAAAAFTRDNWQHLSSEAIRDRIAEIENDKRDWQEFSIRAEGMKAITIKSMRGVLALVEAAEEGARIAEIQRSEAAERDRLAWEEFIAEQARKSAEEKARLQAEELAQSVERERERIEHEKYQAEARAKQAESEKVEAAQRREEEAAAKAKQDQEAAIEAERQRVAAEKRCELEEAEKRAKNRAHLAAVNREVLADLIALGASEEFGKVLIEGIVKGGIRHTTIAY